MSIEKGASIMAVTATCQCGASYQLKDEFLGRSLTCSKCGATMVAQGVRAEPPSSLPARRYEHEAFDRDIFLLRQKVMTVSEKYDVWNEEGQSILFIERPAHLLRNLGAFLAGVLAAGVTAAVLAGAFGAMGLMNGGGGASVLAIGFLVLASLAALLVVAIWLYRRRDTHIYTDKNKQELLIKVLQDKKVEILTATYRVVNKEGEIIARFYKNRLYNFIRKRWVVFAPDGSTMVLAKEDSIILSLLRRLLGPLFGVLRTNFIIVDPRDETVLGEFNRKFTLLDRYKLDMSADDAHRFDRRIALALGVMLDSGERR
jgi:uncharacterized protein YxjI